MSVQMKDVAAKYVEDRDRIAALEKEIATIKEFQKKREDWMAGHLAEQGVESVKTEFGTIYTYRKESVTMAEWDTFLSLNLFKVVENEVGQQLIAKGATPDALEKFTGLIHEALKSAPWHLLNKAVSKTAALEVMGDADKKTGSRPNPPPAGVNYVAVKAVGIRKPGKE